MDEFVYGYGATKHLPSGVSFLNHDSGLCGAPGGYPKAEPERPTCKRCLKMAAPPKEAKG